MLLGFKADKIILDDKTVINKPLIAVSKDSFKIEGIQVLLHKDYLS